MKTTAQQTQTAKHTFLQMLHRLWVSDFGNMDDFMSCMIALMERDGVTWKAAIELDSDDLYATLYEGMEVQGLFEEEVNDQSKDQFENFERVCEKYLDFSHMYSLQNKAA